jgi:hypothetical protein
MFTGGGPEAFVESWRGGMGDAKGFGFLVGSADAGVGGEKKYPVSLGVVEGGARLVALAWLDEESRYGDLAGLGGGGGIVSFIGVGSSTNRETSGAGAGALG